VVLIGDLYDAADDVLAILRKSRQLGILRLKQGPLNVCLEFVAGRDTFPETRELELTLDFAKDLLRE
jgi:hypothetical protein